MEATTDRTIYNLLTYNEQSINSSNAVFDSGGATIDSLNRTYSTSPNTYNSQISGLRLFTMVAPFSVIFLFCVTGNLLVIATLAINRRMRTAFNAFLLNLAIADLLLGIFCMPFTLSGFIMKEFIFGAIMCRLIPYLQAVSVSVSSWTLVTMSVERYYATCQPLKSKSYRQNWAHVFKVIGGVWLFSFIFMSPIAFLSQLIPTTENKMKCRENWPSENYLIFFTYFLDILLFVIPLFIMMISYFLIASYQIATRQSSTDATYADGDTFCEGTQSQTNYSVGYQEKTDSCSPIVRSSPAMHFTNSPLRLEPINGRTSNQLSNKIRHRSTSPNQQHELLSAKSSSSKPKTISFSSSLENISLDDRELVLTQKQQNGDDDYQPTTPSPSIFTNAGNEHSPIFKSVSMNSKTNLDITRKDTDTPLRNGRSPAKSDRAQQITDYRFSLRKKDKNNNQERSRKPSSSTMNSVAYQHGSNTSSNENSLYISTDQQHAKLDGDRPSMMSGKEATAMKLRSSVDRRQTEKRQSRVIKMLAILVLEFFVCWTPLHCINLISLYKPKIVYQALGYDGLGLFFLLAYLSSCTNPITYCFMNSKFRQSFLTLFGCFRTSGETTNPKQTLKPKIRSTTIEEL